MPACNICNQPLDAPVYQSPQPVSVTSLCEVLSGSTEVFHCASCGHVQTTPMADLAAYYDKTYQILIASDDEDQLYAIVDGQNIFRTGHQVQTLLHFVDIPRHARVLDFGCAKASTLRALCERRTDVQAHTFDVSEMYRPFWDKFVPLENQATYQPKAEWREHFDLVMSFFAFEHMADPQAVLSQATALLRPGGTFYCVVPNLFTNIADFVVADHVNHFTESSLRRLFAGAGLKIERITDAAHTGAWVCCARKTALPVESGGENAAERVQEIASYWHGFGERVREFESAHRGLPGAIYGSSFYGTFITTQMRRPESVTCYLDQNPHRQNQTLLGRPIVAPERVSAEVRVIYVGLNPAHARATIQTVTALPPERYAFFHP